MKLLEEKIQKEGEVLGDDILRVDSFVSHQVDLPLMEELGKDMAEHFRGQGVTKVFTIESSGIAPAVFTARALGVPLVILKKQNAENLGTEVWQTEVVSYTKDTSYRLTLAKNYISDADHVLIVDDFPGKRRGGHGGGPADPEGPRYRGGRRRADREGFLSGKREAGGTGNSCLCPGQHPGV